MSKSTKMRFAILCRVSTERQGEKGESLPLQEKQLKEMVIKLGGTIPKGCVYSGQEHSSEGYERKILNNLLRDAESGNFDAVMITDISRLGRDLIVYLQSIERLKRAGVDLYINTNIFDYNNPEQIFSHEIIAASSKFVANISSKKTIESKIERASRGWYISGKMPYGRRIINTDKKEGNAVWEIIPEAKKEILKIYNLYVVKCLSIKQIAVKVGGKPETIRKRLQFGCGDTFVQKFTNKIFNIHKVIETKVPPILTKQQIQNVKDQAASNRTFRGTKYTYPLAHRVICSSCGSVLSGASVVKPDGRIYLYYRHCNDKLNQSCPNHVPAEPLEKAVFSQIGQLLKYQSKLESAINTALDKTRENKTELEDTLKALLREINKKEKELDDDLQKIDLLELKGPALIRMRNSIDKKSELLEDQYKDRDILENKLSVLKQEIPKDLYKRVEKFLFALTGLNGNAPASWSKDDQQKLAEFFFGRGKANEIRLGVSVKNVSDQTYGGYYSYELHGMLGNASGVLSDFVELNDRYTDEKISGEIKASELLKLTESVSEKLPKRKKGANSEFELKQLRPEQVGLKLVAQTFAG